MELVSGKPRKCLMCWNPEVDMILDTAERRLYDCDQCGATEIITKGNGSWWYHGAIRPDGHGIDGDGKAFHRDNYGWWDRP